MEVVPAFQCPDAISFFQRDKANSTGRFMNRIIIIILVRKMLLLLVLFFHYKSLGFHFQLRWGKSLFLAVALVRIFLMSPNPLNLRY
jgi:hypothetical protein